MSTATVEEFQKNAGTFIAAVERGEPIAIARGQKVVARLLPVEDNGAPETEHQDWTRAALANLARAFGPTEPDYDASMIVETNPYYKP